MLHDLIERDTSDPIAINELQNLPQTRSSNLVDISHIIKVRTDQDGLWVSGAFDQKIGAIAQVFVCTVA